MSVETRDTKHSARAQEPPPDSATTLIDRSDRLRMRFTGDKAAESLTGLVTSDVVSLTPGRGQYAAALTPKGKVLADLRIFARPGELLTDVSPAAAAGWTAMIRKFVNPRLAKYEDITQSTFDLGVFGAAAAGAIRAALPDVTLAGDLPMYHHVNASLGDTPVMIARVPDFGVDGYDIIGPRPLAEEVRARLIAAGATERDAAVLDAARIEAGRPAWGVDMDDTMLAQEVDLDRLEAISFTKGCYTGQETVARVHYRGHVNRHLRGLRFGNGPLPPPGTALTDGAGKDVGVVRSGATSPRRGVIALALVRREIEPGSTVTARWDAEQVDGTVEQLPFP